MCACAYVETAQPCFLFNVYSVSLKATVAAWTPVSCYSVGSTSDVVLWLCSGFFLKNTVWKQHSHKYVQNGFWPESLCVLTNGCCKPESGMQQFRLRGPSCLFLSVAPNAAAAMCQLMTSQCVTRGSGLLGVGTWSGRTLQNILVTNQFKSDDHYAVELHFTGRGQLERKIQRCHRQ